MFASCKQVLGCVGWKQSGQLRIALNQVGWVAFCVCRRSSLLVRGAVQGGRERLERGRDIMEEYSHNAIDHTHATLPFSPITRCFHLTSATLHCVQPPITASSSRQKNEYEQADGGWRQQQQQLKLCYAIYDLESAGISITPSSYACILLQNGRNRLCSIP